MKTFAQVIDLQDDPDVIARYEEYHRAVWPEVLASLRQIGIIRMEIFRSGNHLFMYCTARDDFDPARDFQGYTELSPKAAEWNDLMMQYQQKVPEAGPDDWWAPTSLAFDSEWFE